MAVGGKRREHLGFPLYLAPPLLQRHHTGQTLLWHFSCRAQMCRVRGKIGYEWEGPDVEVMGGVGLLERGM